MIEDNLFRFTRRLVDLDSTTGRESPATDFVAACLRQLEGLAVETWPVEPGRDNLFAWRGTPRVVLSTHLDTVPPFFPSREDAEAIYGRGACDAKGIAAAQIFAAIRLLQQGCTDFGLLFLVGEERNSAGAIAANARRAGWDCGSRFLVNGEPTASKMVRAGKGVLRLNLAAHGRSAHSAYPELGESAIEKMLAALERIRALPLPRHPELGPTTLNIGTLAGGQAPNVIPDAAQAELMFRLVEDGAGLRRCIMDAVAGLAQAEFVLEIPPITPRVIPGFPTATVAFATDIPNLAAWGQPLLFGPGAIEVAHTPHEHIAKAELAAGVDAYVAIVRHLQFT
ncbi:MAG: M20/M25/M40 family metallo-hydrolase [Terriglobales bacterium]